MSEWRIDANILHWRLARVNSTFSRRSPPSLETGPKFCDMYPPASFPYPIEMKITSRSSPWTFSKFLTKKGSSLLSLQNASSSGYSVRMNSSVFRIVSR